jgi:hypothetical protein
MNEILSKITFFDGFMIALVPVILIVVVINLFNYIKFRNSYLKAIKKYEKEKCEGPHSWISMEVNKEFTNVCRDCCYSPKHDGYANRIFVDAEIERQNFRKNLEIYTEQTLAEIAKNFELTENQVSNIYNKIISIKQDFAIEHLDKKLKELGEESE